MSSTCMPPQDEALQQSSPVDLILRAESVLTRQIQKSNRNIIAAAIVFLLFLAGGFALTVFWGQSSTDPELLRTLEETGEQQYIVARELIHAMSDMAATTRTRELIAEALEQVALNNTVRVEASKLLASQQRSPDSGALDILQLLLAGGGAALLGILGLQRLQGIDSEINMLRSSLVEQIRLRAEDNLVVLEGATSKAIDSRFERIQSEVTRINKVVTELEDSARHILDQANEAATSTLDTLRSEVKETESKITSLLQQYPWLRDNNVTERADEIAGTASVGEARDLATRFKLEGDTRSARVVLRQITSKGLSGSTEDYHNASVVATRLRDTELSLQIVELGLDRYPNHFDLIADRTNLLAKLGRISEAISDFRAWYRAHPSEIARGWRPLVFYWDALALTTLAEGELHEVEELAKDVLRSLSDEVKVWRALVEIQLRLGSLNDAELTMRQSVRAIPYSQQLNYNLGEYLLSAGRADDALEFLEAAARFDYQETYQHDVVQEAVLCTLAQCYEALNRQGDAVSVYTAITKKITASSQIREYSSNRLWFIRTLQLWEEDPATNEGPANSTDQRDQFVNAIASAVYSALTDDEDAAANSEELLDGLRENDAFEVLASRIQEILRGERDRDLLIKDLDEFDRDVIDRILELISTARA